jgi:carnosine synthase
MASNFLTEAVIGSLPKGLSVSEREQIFSETPLSPTMNVLSSMPSNVVSSRSLEGRRLRRHVLRGAVIVFITAGYSGKRFIFEKAKELGVRSVIVDGPDSWSKSLVSEGIIENFISLDMSDAETVFDRALVAIQKLRKDLGELDGIVSFSEMAMPLVSRLAEKLGLPGNPPSAVDEARDKHATRRKMAEENLPTPKNFLIESESQLKEASATVGYPAVIKPIYGAASIGVVRVDSYEDLERCYKKVTKDLSSARIVAGALQQGDEEAEEEAQDKASSWIRTTIMMEEYLDGPEVDVDLVMSEGEAVYGAVTDNWPTVEPYFLETGMLRCYHYILCLYCITVVTHDEWIYPSGSNAPSILPTYQQRELLDLSVKTVKCLGFTNGVFHVESKYTSRGPRLIEVNCRMGGGPVRTMNMLVWGVDLVEEQLLCSAGIPSNPPVALKPLMNIAEYSVNAMKTGVLKSNDHLEKYQDDKDVLYARPLIEPGTKVVSAKDGLPTWICELMITKPTVDEAIEFVKRIEADIQDSMVIV